MATLEAVKKSTPRTREELVAAKSEVGRLYGVEDDKVKKEAIKLYGIELKGRIDELSKTN